MNSKRLEPPMIIAEIGCNHKGDLEIAKEMIITAKIFCRADAVKFQKRSVKETLSPEEYNAPHPNPYNSYGSTYGEHREFLEFSLDQHQELKKLCDEQGIIYSCSVWDLTSAQQIASLNPPFIKIPSALSDNFEVLGWLCANYLGDIHISTGMTTKQEIRDIVDYFIEHKRNHNLVVYHCTSGYPIEFKDACLFEIVRLKKEYGDMVKSIGFSGHHNGIAIDIAAFTLGASIIERHYTLNRTWKGTDHAASLEPDGLRRLKRNLMATYEALQFKEFDLLEIEKPQRRKLRWNRNQ